MHAELEQRNHPADPVWAKKPLSDLLSENGVAQINHPESRERLRRLILRGLIEARRRMHERLGGGEAGEKDSYFSNIDPDAPRPSQLKPVKGTNLQELLSQFLSEQSPKNLRSKTLSQYRAVVGRFEEVIGANTPITEITRQHCIAFRDLLAQMPSNASKRFRGMKMQQVANAAKEKDWPRLTARSVNKSMETLSALLSYATDQADLIRKNPAKRLRLETDGEKVDRTFDKAQLRTLFGSALFQEYVVSSDPEVKHSRYWVPFIALFCGMRQNEICQLYIEDIKQRDGIYFFAVREKLDDGSVAPDKHLKTKNARRDIPIHPALLKRGFLELVQIKKQAGAKRLFEELPYSAGQNYSDAFQKWFSRLLRDTGVCAERKVTFHGLRHTFRDALRRGTVLKEHSQALGGWNSDESLSEHYGRGYPLDVLLREISKVSYWDVFSEHPAKR